MVWRPGRSWASVVLGLSLGSILIAPAPATASAAAVDAAYVAAPGAAVNASPASVPPTVSLADASTANPPGLSWDFRDESSLSTVPSSNDSHPVPPTNTVQPAVGSTGGANAAPRSDDVSPAALTQAGYEGPSYQGVTYSPSYDKPESKLWWNDGIWWADMFDSTSGRWHIFRLDRSTETWADTGTQIDARANTLSDALWDGRHLYVASHVVTISTDTETTSSLPNQPAYLYRFSYSTSTQSYTLDSGFPVTITTWSSESMTIDEDSTGVIWATWTQVSGSAGNYTNAVYVNNSAAGDASTWGTPFVLPVGSVANPSPDDISALVSYKDDYIGLLWPNQRTGNVYWAVHHDGDPVGTWQGSVALAGPNAADDHMNLKTLQSDAAGRVYAAVKTSADAGGIGSAALIDLLVFTPGSGAWSKYTFGTVDDCHTRPIVVLDSDNQMVHMYATAPTAGDGCLYTGVPGTIYEKTAPMSNPVFSTGSGTPVIQDPSSHNINDATSTKQSVTDATGIVVLASNSGTNHYWFMDESLGTVPPPVASFTANPTSGTVPLSVSFTDTSTGNPTGWSWDFGDGSPLSTLQNPGHNYTVAGAYTAKLTASNSGGSNTAQATITVNPPTVPGRPTGVTAIAGNAAAAVSWAAAAANGSAIIGYAVTSSPGSKTCTTAGALSCNVTGLTNGQTYTFTVRATNGIGTGPASDPSNSVTPAAVPGKPTGVTATAGASYATVAWVAPADNGGSAITSYAVTSSPEGKTCTTAGALSCAVSGLTAGTPYYFTVIAANAVGPGPASDPSTPVTPHPLTASTFHPLSPPVRMLDTRSGNGLPKAKIAANTPATFAVTAETRPGSLIPAGATAVTGNVTVVNSTSSWAIYLGPTPIAHPSTSTINFTAGEVAGNGLTIALSSTGSLSATYMSGAGNTTDLVFDVTGYFTLDTSGATYHPMTPARVLDTRNATGGLTRLTANTPATFTVAGTHGIPASAKAVTGNITVVNPSNSWAVYLGPLATATPGTSTINFNAGQVKGNSLTVTLGDLGTLSATYMSSSGATIDLVFDVTGYYTADLAGALFVPMAPARLLDTRNGNGLPGRISANTPATFQITGRSGIPGGVAGAIAVTGNVTVVNDTNSWAVFLGPDPTPNPGTSTVNFNKGEVKGNGLTVALGSGGTIAATYISSAGNTTDLVLDVTGYFVP
jgi:PKD repeat protein